MVLVDLTRNVYQKFTGQLSVIYFNVFRLGYYCFKMRAKASDDDECFKTVDDFPVFCPGALRKSSVDVR
jgi:hypothetical protein